MGTIEVLVMVATALIAALVSFSVQELKTRIDRIILELERIKAEDDARKEWDEVQDHFDINSEEDESKS
jgi:hypothetical protein